MTAIRTIYRLRLWVERELGSGVRTPMYICDSLHQPRLRACFADEIGKADSFGTDCLIKPFATRGEAIKALALMNDPWPNEGRIVKKRILVST